ncbi:LIM domain-binding protein 2 [Operophtera brumata]|uniref:LIM domain-binding protein 2 n=1 Tax=Operophtera brumata TaxID=104452 RepID=A0A0L7L786_OPEBR|nr:LIM domain-binding protein 2 [Operophtera brumata]
MVTHHGEPMFTKVCTEGRLILEFTFDDLMRIKSWHLAAYALSPRDCLKTTLFQKWQRMVAPPESQRPASKRRKRKGSAGANAAPAAPAKTPPGPH